MAEPDAAFVAHSIVPARPSSEDQLLNAVMDGHHTEAPLYAEET